MTIKSDPQNQTLYKKIYNFSFYIFLATAICSISVSIAWIHYELSDLIFPGNLKIKLFALPLFLGFILSFAIVNQYIKFVKLRQQNSELAEESFISSYRKLAAFRIKNILHYLPFVLISMAIVFPLASAHMLLVLKIDFNELSSLSFFIPANVSIIFGFLSGNLALLRRKQEFLLKERSRKIVELEEFAGDILNSQESIVILTDGVRIRRVNNKFYELFYNFHSLDEFSVYHNCISDLFISENGKNYIQKEIKGENWIRYISRHNEFGNQALLMTDGKKRIFYVTANKLTNENSNLYVATFTEITSIIFYKDQLEIYSEKIKLQLYTDTLTGLSNRMKLIQDLSLSEKNSLIIINIDSFQEMNNFFGHEMGDEILKKVSNRINTVCEKYNLELYRIGGDIFAALVPVSFSMVNLQAVSEEISECISENNFILDTGSELNINVTMGVVNNEFANANQIDILTMGNIALKTAKENRKKFILYSDEIKNIKSYGENIHQANVFKNAVSREKILTYYQPIRCNLTGKTEKYECLARISDFDGGIILPDNFINAAKASKLYSHITRSVIVNACKTFQGNDFQFSVNLSIHDIIESSTVNFIFETLKKYNVSGRIIFEILESEGIHNFETIVNFINTAKTAGCKIAIDDFGSGFSNFNYLLNLDIDYLKIDQILIKNIDSNKKAELAVKNIVKFSNDLNIETVAEHIHTEQVLEKVQELGVNYSQGFHIGIPSPSL